MKLRLAMLQISSFKTDLKKNLEKGELYCRKAKELNADIVLFPEMFNTGYETFDPAIWRNDNYPVNVSADSELKIKEWASHAIDTDSEFINQFKLLAKELDIAIAITYLQRGKDKPLNSVALIDRHGKIVLNYSKVHTCDFAMEYFCEPGKEFYVCDLNTKEGNFKIGAMICFDREFPESARELMLLGAEIILIPNCCDMDSHRTAQLKSRAFENMVGVALANYPSPKCNGKSQAYSPVAYSPSNADCEGVELDNLLVMADDSEGIFIAEFNMVEIREYRKHEVWGNAYRKIKAYHLQNSPEVEFTFRRKEKRTL